MNAKEALDVVVGSLICSIVNEDLNNCDYCPVREYCDDCIAQKNFNPLDENIVHRAVVKLWDEEMYKTLEPVLTMFKGR